MNNVKLIARKWKHQDGGIVSTNNIPKHFFGNIIKKIKYRSAPTYEANSLKEAITKAYRDGNKGKNFWYKDNVYKAVFNDADEKQYQQHEQNRQITNDQVVDTYIDNVLWTMENPKNKGYNKKKGKYFSYKDSSLPKNIGPGIAYTSEMAQDMNFSKGYTKNELNAIVRPALLESMEEISNQMHDKYGEDADTLSLGNRLIQLDIAHNVRPRGSKKSNMPVTGWPTLTDAMMRGDKAAIEKNTNSGSDRRQSMRNMLIWQNIIDKNTVKNK